MMKRLLTLLSFVAIPAFSATVVLQVPDGCTLTMPSMAVTCGVTQPPPPQTPICTPSASAVTATIGSTVTLSANCSNGPTSYGWTGASGNCAGATCDTTAASAGHRLYSVSGTNSAGTGATAAVGVTWTAVPNQADMCGAYPDVVRLTQPWGNPRIYPGAYGGVFRDGMVLVVAIDVPATQAYASNTFSATTAEYVHQAVWAHATLSRIACDFRESDPTGANGPISQGYTASASVYGSVPANMTPGQTYYVNVKWLSPFSCSSTCASLIGFQWPR